MNQNQPCFNLSFKMELEARVGQLKDINIKRPSLNFEKSVMKDEGRSGLIPRRYIIVILGFFSFTIINCQRINLSMALVAMRNETPTSHFSKTNDSGQLALPEKDYFVEETYPEGYQNVRSKLLWDAETQSHIMSASFLGFVVTNIPGGRLSETMGAKGVLIFSLACASVSNILSPVASTWGAYALLGVQLVKGLAQGFIQPAVSCIMARWFPTLEKGFLSSVAMSGYPAGAIVGGLLSGALCDSDYLGGWPSVFYLFGFCGLFLMIFVYIYLSESPDEDESILISELKYINAYRQPNPSKNDSVIPWKKMLSSPATWAVFIGMFGQYWLTFYFLSVHPTYLGAIMHYSNTESGYLNSLPYIGQIIVIWISSYSSDWCVRRKYASVNSVRKVCNSLSCTGFALGMIGLVFAQSSPVWNAFLVIVAISAIGFGYPGSCIVPIDMSHNFAGTLMGLTCTVASTSGFIIPLIIGSLTNNQQTLQQWNKVFYISAGVSLGSGIIFILFGSSNLQEWDTQKNEKKQSVEGIENGAFEQNLEISLPITISSFCQDLNNLPIFAERL